MRTMPRVTLDHLVGGLEAGVGDLGHAELLMVRLLRRDHRSVGHLNKKTRFLFIMLCLLALPLSAAALLGV